jgi:hypothetical protein
MPAPKLPPSIKVSRLYTAPCQLVDGSRLPVEVTLHLATLQELVQAMEHDADLDPESVAVFFEPQDPEPDEDEDEDEEESSVIIDA